MNTCQRNCWIAGGVAGLATMIYLMSIHEYGIFGALIWGVIIGAVVAVILLFVLCSGIKAEPEAPPKRVGTPEPAAKAEPAPEPAPEPEPQAAAEPQAAPAAAEPEAAVEPEEKPAEAEPGSAAKPETLSGPRGGKSDDLKKIKGVGPKLEGVLNGLGFYHFDQIAAWTDAEVAWVDENLGGFSGRVKRDDWVGQARTLAAGGETEFSQKVDKGDVY